MIKTTLGEICGQHGGLIQTGPFGSQLHQRDYSNIGVPVVMPKDIYDGRVVVDGIARIPEAKASQLSRHKLPVNSLLIPRRGEIAKRALIQEDQAGFLCGTGCVQIVVPEKVLNPRWLYYFLAQRHVIEWLERNAIGTTMLNLNTKIIGGITIRLIPIHEQTRIAGILSAYDDLIENNRRRIQLLEQSARLLYKEWFVRLRFPGHERVKINDGVPEGWERKPLSAICSEIRDAVRPDQVEPNTPYIGLEYIPRRSITLNQWGCAEDVESTKFRFTEGDILFGKIRPYFHKVGIALTEGITSSDSIVIRANEKRLTPYCLALVSSDQFVAVASKTAKEGSKMPRADWKFMEQHPILLPTHSVLLGFNQFFDDILKQLKLLALQGKKLANARDLLLPRLMNGEIAV